MENSKIVQENMKKRKDWITGDTFALLIKNTEYKKENGKYLIFIYDDYAKDELSRSYPVFRVKITKDKRRAWKLRIYNYWCINSNNRSYWPIFCISTLKVVDNLLFS